MSSIEPDPRPRPRYGEYATPEEVARLRGDAAPRAAGIPPQRDLQIPLPTAAGAQSPPSGARDASAPRRRGDIAVTVALLVFALWNVLGAMPAFSRLDASLAQSFAMMPGSPEGIVLGEPTRVTGQLLIAVWAVLFLAAVGFSVMRIRARRRAFWVPLVFGALSVLAVLIAITTLIVVEPGLAPLLELPPSPEN